MRVEVEDEGEEDDEVVHDAVADADSNAKSHSASEALAPFARPSGTAEMEKMRRVHGPPASSAPLVLDPSASIRSSWVVYVRVRKAGDPCSRKHRRARLV